MDPGMGGNPSSGRFLSGLVTSMGTLRCAAAIMLSSITFQYSSSLSVLDIVVVPSAIVNVPRDTIKSASWMELSVQPAEVQ